MPIYRKDKPNSKRYSNKSVLYQFLKVILTYWNPPVVVCFHYILLKLKSSFIHPQYPVSYVLQYNIDDISVFVVQFPYKILMDFCLQNQIGKNVRVDTTRKEDTAGVNGVF